MKSPTPDGNSRAFVEALWSTTRDRHDDMRALVSALPDGGLTWTPADESPAIAGLASHILDVDG